MTTCCETACGERRWRLPSHARRGYWQVENYLISVAPGQIVISDTATFTPVSGRERQMEMRDLDDVFKRAHQGA